MVTNVLVAVDGSDNSMRALRLGVEFADRFGANLDAVHVTDHETPATEAVLDRVGQALDSLDAGGVDPELDVVASMDVPTAREAARRLLELVSDRGYDHVVVGHHGAGTVERAILGSASETVVRGTPVPVTVVP